MEIEEIKKIIENAYAHIPTLPGYWIDYTKFEEEFHRILEAKGYLADTNIQEALEKAFPDYKKIDEYKSNDQETPIVAIRIAPNKLNRISKLKKHLIENINKTPEDKDGWKNFASLGLNGVKEEVLNLDFGSVRDAMNMIFPRYYEFRKGDIKRLI